MIKAAYNFVPVTNDIEYYKPDWSNLISHDVPFSDGVSGEITLSLVANTALFVKGNNLQFYTGAILYLKTRTPCFLKKITAFFDILEKIYTFATGNRYIFYRL